MQRSEQTTFDRIDSNELNWIGFNLNFWTDPWIWQTLEIGLQADKNRNGTEKMRMP